MTADGADQGSDLLRGGYEQHCYRMVRETSESERAEARLDRSQRDAFIIALSGLVLAAIVAILGGSAAAASVIAIVAVGGPVAATALARLIRSPD